VSALARFPLILLLTVLVSCGCTDDADGDGVADPDDNCPHTRNPGQKDSDADGRGDRCDRRGIYHWGGDCHDWGNLNVVGVPANEDEAIDTLRKYRFSRVYSSLGERVKDAPAPIAAWNRKLHEHDIESYLLMAHNTWAYDWEGLEDKIEDRLVAFNNSHVAEESFDGLALDVEPHALNCSGPNCWTDDLEDRRELLGSLGLMYTAVDALLETHLGPDFPLLAAIVPWYDHLEEPDRDFYWESETARDDWWCDLLAATEGVSLMTYCRDTFDVDVANSVGWMTRWEAGYLGGRSDLRVALASHVFAVAPSRPIDPLDRDRTGIRRGDCDEATWMVAARMFDVAEEIEAWELGCGPPPAVDVHNLRFLFETLGIQAPQPASCP